MVAEIVASHRAVVETAGTLDHAVERRAIVFALAQEHGVSSGQIARMTGATPQQVMHAIRVGRGIIASRRRRFARSEVAA
jgi:DNA-directed RNA polymerase specialized sigma24 family protein